MKKKALESNISTAIEDDGEEDVEEEPEKKNSEQVFTYSLTHRSLTHSLTHALLTHSLTHSLVVCVQ